MIAGLSATTLLVLVLGAVVVGISKTALAGLGPVATVLFTLVMSAHDATGAVLVLLIACDLVAIFAYRRSCDWRLIRVLMPSLVVGIALGAWFVTLVDDTVLRRTIGVLLLLMGLTQCVQEFHGARRARREGPAGAGQRAGAGRAGDGDGAATAGVASSHDPDDAAAQPAPHRAIGFAAGSAAGFTTMTANAAGPVMSLYLLYLRVPKMVFVGTSAWFYWMANLVKLPFAIGIGLVHPGSIWLNLALVVPALAGCAVGLWLLPRISQTFFNRLALALAVGSSLLLLLR